MISKIQWIPFPELPTNVCIVRCRRRDMANDMTRFVSELAAYLKQVRGTKSTGAEVTEEYRRACEPPEAP